MKKMIVCLLLLISSSLFVQCENGITNSDSDTPVVKTASVYEVTATNAQCGGTVKSEGASEVTARGLCWSENPEPTLDDSYTVNGRGKGKFMSLVSGLTVNKTYYIRAYATNQKGTSYGKAESFYTQESVKDVDGNRYAVVLIGKQYWMAENLRVTHYRNGDEIPALSDSSLWSSTSDGARCSYGNNEANAGKYGYLYNWYAATDSRNIAPYGWHVPTAADWQTLFSTIHNSGGQLKEAGDQYWASPNTGATNETGFAALPAGERSNTGRFDFLSFDANFWSTTPAGGVTATYLYLTYSQGQAFLLSYGRHYGFSIRCVRDRLASGGDED